MRTLGIGRLLLIVSLFISGCEQPSPSMRIATNSWIGYAPLYLAREQGFLSSQEFRLINSGSASDVMQLYRNGLVEAAALTLDEVVQLEHEGYRPKVVLVLDVSLGADVILSHPDIKELKSLKGKRVGVESTALGAFFLQRALDSCQLDISDVTVVPSRSNEHETAFLSGKVDAVVTFEPMRGNLLKQGAIELFSSKDLPGEIVDVLVVSEDYYKKNPQRVALLQDAWYRSIDYLYNNEATALKSLASFLGQDLQEAALAYKGIYIPNRKQNQRYIHPESGKLIQIKRQLRQVMIDRHLL